MLINNRIEGGSENKYPPLLSGSAHHSQPTPHHNMNIVYTIKYSYTNNNFDASLAWCWGLKLRVWLNLLGLKLLQCLDSLFF